LQADWDARVPDKLQRASVAARSRDPGVTRHDADGWAPAQQRTAKEALRCVRGTSAEWRTTPLRASQGLLAMTTLLNPSS